jgi:hypothetical protein
MTNKRTGNDKGTNKRAGNDKGTNKRAGNDKGTNKRTGNDKGKDKSERQIQGSFPFDKLRVRMTTFFGGSLGAAGNDCEKKGRGVGFSLSRVGLPACYFRMVGVDGP